jgi:hypothetical protein
MHAKNGSATTILEFETGGLDPRTPTEGFGRSRRLRSLIRQLPPRPPRVRLERACRIALMEGEGPVSAEAIYERVLRRGSLGFLGYKRPFSVIAAAMSALCKEGEARMEIRPHNSSAAKRGLQRVWMKVIRE